MSRFLTRVPLLYKVRDVSKFETIKTLRRDSCSENSDEEGTCKSVFGADNVLAVGQPRQQI